MKFLCFQTEKRQQESLQRSIASELEWVNSNAKGQQKKGKARLRRYEDLTKQVIHYFTVLLSVTRSPRLAQDRLLCKQLVAFVLVWHGSVLVAAWHGLAKDRLACRRLLCFTILWHRHAQDRLAWRAACCLCTCLAETTPCLAHSTTPPIG